MYDLAVKNGKIYRNSGWENNNIYMRDGIIEEISSRDLEARTVLEGEGLKVLPGIIDPHVHFALSVGNFCSADNFQSGSAAGLYGGVTTYIDFLDPVGKGSLVKDALDRRLAQARISHSDYSFHVTAANPVGETESLTDEALRLGIPSIKIFTAYSESGRRTYPAELEELLSLSEKRGTVVLVHGEDEDHITSDPQFGPDDLPGSRPEKSESSMVASLCDMVNRCGGTLYMVHTTCGSSLISARKILGDKYGVNFFMESGAQYFLLNEEHLKGDEGYKYVLAPPLRSLHESETLKKEIDTLFSVGTDHCPFLLKEKKKSLLTRIPFGIGGIEYSFPLMYTLFGDKIIDKMTINPAKLFDLAPRKGMLEPGSDGDLFLFRDGEGKIKGTGHSRCDYNVYENYPVEGQVEKTVLRGQLVMNQQSLTEPEGRFLTRKATK